MRTDITKRRARELLGVSTDAELARLFATSRSAVAQWAEDRPLPELRQLQIVSGVVKPIRRRRTH